MWGDKVEEMWETSLLSILLHHSGGENAFYQGGGLMGCRTVGIKYTLTLSSNQAVF